ncbi:MAG: CheR family methyltransferase, partial [Polyangiaceae bacterium]
QPHGDVVIERAWPQHVLQRLATSIREHAGLSFIPARFDDLERRTRRAMAKVGSADVGDYQAGLGDGRYSFDDWVAELTVGETYFFREPGHFDFLRRRALPGLLALRGAGHVFRVWSAGCASGEEAYSLAILFEEQLLDGSLHLLGTDLSRVALARAKHGVYGPWSLRNAKSEWVDLYFHRRPQQQFEVIPRIRRLVQFDYLNLALDEYPSFFTGVWGNDIVFCRNVLIYLDRDTIRAVARRLFESLGEGGWLITGPSDPPLGDFAPYETVISSEGVFYRRSQAHPSQSPTATDKEKHRLGASDEIRADREARPAAEEDETSSVRVVAAARPIETQKVSSKDQARFDPARSFAEAPDSLRTPQKESATEARTADTLSSARAAFTAGSYARSIALAQELEGDPSAAALEVRATANLYGARDAARLCTAALLRFPLGAELYVLQASLLLDLRDYDAATQAARRLLYLDRSLVVAHLLLGSILAKRGDREEAARAFRNARDLAAFAPPLDDVPFADGEKAGRLADFARAQIELLHSPTSEGRWS